LDFTVNGDIRVAKSEDKQPFLRTRMGHICTDVEVDYSLRAFLQVAFQRPAMR